MKIEDPKTLQILLAHKVALTAMTGFTDITFDFQATEIEGCLKMNNESGDSAFINLKVRVL